MIDVPESVAVERNRQRPDRDFGSHVVSRQHRDLKRSLRGSTRKASAACTSFAEPTSSTPSRSSASGRGTTAATYPGPFDIIGDIHGCASELRASAHRARLGDRVRRDSRASARRTLTDARPFRRRPRRPRPGHSRGAASGHGHGRRRQRAVRLRQPRGQARARPAGREGDRLAWAGRVPCADGARTRRVPRRGAASSWTA